MINDLVKSIERDVEADNGILRDIWVNYAGARWHPALMNDRTSGKRGFELNPVGKWGPKDERKKQKLTVSELLSALAAGALPPGSTIRCAREAGAAKDHRRTEDFEFSHRLARYFRKTTSGAIERDVVQSAGLSESDDSYDDLYAGPYGDIGSDGAQRTSGVKSGVKRDPRVRRVVLERSGGVCERSTCRVRSRFASFLDVHHVLGAEVSDRVWNCVALCPNCHRETHFAPDQKEINALLLRYAEAFRPRVNRR